MKGPSKLIEHEDYWPTQMGLTFGGERVVFRGNDLFHDLKDMRWMELFLFGITGRKFSEKQVLLFEGLWVLGNSYPDPRIWNNRVASLAGTARSTCTLALSAAISLSEATIYGRRPDIKAIDFLIRTRKRMIAGEDLDQVIKNELGTHRGIPGYGRPIVNGDERINPGRELARKLGYDSEPYYLLAFDVEQALLRNRYRFKMNAAALGAALAADQGMDPQEYYRFLTPSFTAGILPCFIDTAEREEGLFLPMPCSRIEYSGTQRRSWSEF